MTSVHDQIITNQNNSTITKAAQQQNQVKSSSSSIASQDFLFLLTQQLQYQDPMNPMDNSQMLAQEAQFATLEQMEALTSNFSKFSSVYQANSLLGQTVEVEVDNDTTKGKVEFIDYSDAKGASVSIEGKMYPLNSITKVYPPDTKVEEEYRNFFVDAALNIAGNIADIGKKLNSYLGIETPEEPDSGSDKDTDTDNTTDTQQ